MLVSEEYDKFLNYSHQIDKEIFIKNFNQNNYDLMKNNFSRFWFYQSVGLRKNYLKLANCNIELYDEYNKLIRYIYDISVFEFDRLFFDLQYTNAQHDWKIDGIPNKLYWFKHHIYKFWNSLELEEKNKLLELIDSYEFEIGELINVDLDNTYFEKISIQNKRYTQEEVNNLPDGIIELGCNDSKITSLDFLPSSIIRIDCGNNEIKNLDNLPENLKILVCYSNRLSSIDNLPSELEYLDISNNLVSKLSNLPKSLKTLLIDTNCLDDISGLPENLEKLDISFNDIQSLDNLPSNLKVLKYVNCCIEQIENLPEKLETLILQRSETILIKNLPSTIKHLDISETSIENLDILPPKLEYLDVACTSIKSLDNLPESLLLLNILDSEVEYLGTLPRNLIHLNISYSGIQDIKLPKMLKQFSFKNMNFIKELPDSIKSIDCYFCDIKNIKYFPNNIYNLYFNDNITRKIILPYNINGRMLDNNFILVPDL